MDLDRRRNPSRSSRPTRCITDRPIARRRKQECHCDFVWRLICKIRFGFMECLWFRIETCLAGRFGPRRDPVPWRDACTVLTMLVYGAETREKVLKLQAEVMGIENVMCITTCDIGILHVLLIDFPFFLKRLIARVHLEGETRWDKCRIPWYVIGYIRNLLGNHTYQNCI